MHNASRIIRVVIGATVLFAVLSMVAIVWAGRQVSDDSDTYPAATAPPFPLGWLTKSTLYLPNGDTVPDLFAELPASGTVPTVPEDAAVFDCRVDGNQICGVDAYVVGPYGEPMRVAPGYWGFHCLGEIGNPGARAALGMVEIECQ
ncbi:hypothetical protein [Nocardia brasiliensis]|uniref:hypothetical protein n=1 Tax=Nocardia brasiliensis TaxID=37326 RepID=UPI0036732162